MARPTEEAVIPVAVKSEPLGDGELNEMVHALHSLKEVQKCNDVLACFLPPSLDRGLDCSVCKNEMFSASKIHEHPVLRKVGVCSECYDNVVNTQFTRGHEDQCRWCGRGGTVALCERCEKVFCQECIVRNFGHKRGWLPILKDDNWTCFCCNSRPLRARRNEYKRFQKAVAGSELAFLDRGRKSRASKKNTQNRINITLSKKSTKYPMKQELSDMEQALKRMKAGVQLGRVGEYDQAAKKFSKARCTLLVACVEQARQYLDVR